MATVNFSVPDEVKAAFNEVFAGENKSAIIAQLMQQAVQEQQRQQRRAQAIEALLALRRTMQPVSDEAIHKARLKNRP